MHPNNLPAANSVHRVDLHSGIIGLLTGGARKRLQSGIAMANERGEELVFVIPDVWSFAQNVLAGIILFCTLLLWAPAPGYLIITRRPVGGHAPPPGQQQHQR